MLALAVGALAVAGCDTAPDLPDRSSSYFVGEDPLARSAIGYAYAGTEAVPDAIVRLSATPGLANDARMQATAPPTWTTVTDRSGIYRFRGAPFRYDLTFQRPGEISVFQELTLRFLLPSIAESGPVAAFRARVEPVLDPPLPPSSRVAYFLSGEDAVAIGADASEGASSSHLEARFRKFTSTVTLHALTYVAGEGPAAAISEGRVEGLRLTSGGVLTPAVSLVRVATSATVGFDFAAPSGFAIAGYDVSMHHGKRSSALPVARVAPGQTLRIAIVPGATYTARAQATSASGAAVDSGLVTFVPGDNVVKVELPAPAVAMAPAPAAGAGAELVMPEDRVLQASGTGVHEHALVPVDGGTAIRLVVVEGPARVPDLTRFGLAAASGRYRWTVTRWPDTSLPDGLGGPDARAIQRSSISAPRVVVVP